MSYVSPRHGLNLDIDKSVNGDILTLKVSLSNTSGKYQLWGDDETITVEAGLFADVFGSGGRPPELRPDNSSGIQPSLNRYGTYTFTNDVDTLIFELDLSKVRDNYLKKMRTDLWGGAEAFMFSCRVTDGAKKQSKQYIFAISPAAENNSTLNYMGELQPAMWVDSTTRKPYSLNAGDVMSKTTIDGKSYYKINMLPIISRNDSIGGDWMNAFNTAHRLGVGDYETPTVEFSDVTFVLSCVKSQIADKGNILYYYDSLNSFVGMGGTMRHYESGSQVQNDKEYLERVAATVYGSWDYTQDTELYNYYLSLGSLSAHHTRDALAVRGIQVPLNTLSTSDATESTEWYLSADLYSGDLSFEKICFPEPCRLSTRPLRLSRR